MLSEVARTKCRMITTRPDTLDAHHSPVARVLVLAAVLAVLVVAYALLQVGKSDAAAGDDSGAVAATPTDTPVPQTTPSSTPTPNPTAIIVDDARQGDVDCNIQINSIDAVLILQFAAGLTESLPCLYLADVNGDGDVNSIDAALILQYVAGLIYLPVPSVPEPPTDTPVPTATVVPPTEVPAQPTPTPTAVGPGGTGIRHCWLAIVSARLLGILDFPDFEVPGFYQCSGPSVDDVTYICNVATDSSAACVTSLGPDYFCTFIRIEIGESGFYNSKLDCDVVPGAGADGPDYFCDEGPGFLDCETRQGQGWPDYSCGIMAYLDNGVRMQCSTIHDDFPNFECLIKGVAFDCTVTKQ